MIFSRALNAFIFVSGVSAFETKKKAKTSFAFFDDYSDPHQRRNQWFPELLRNASTDTSRFDDNRIKLKVSYTLMRPPPSSQKRFSLSLLLYHILYYF